MTLIFFYFSNIDAYAGIFSNFFQAHRKVTYEGVIRKRNDDKFGFNNLLETYNSPHIRRRVIIHPEFDLIKEGTKIKINGIIDTVYVSDTSLCYSVIFVNKYELVH